jgi:hypothetical protein
MQRGQTANLFCSKGREKLCSRLVTCTFHGPDLAETRAIEFATLAKLGSDLYAYVYENRQIRTFWFPPLHAK